MMIGGNDDGATKKNGGDARHELGRRGEDIAACYLESRGWRVRGRRERWGGVEIDLVVERPGEIALVEVKTRVGGRYGGPGGALTPPHQLPLPPAKHFRLRHAFSPRAARDPPARRRRVRPPVVAITFPPVGQIGPARLRHYPAAIEE